MRENGDRPEVPSELTILRTQYADEADRSAVDRAYWSYATGDPNTTPVQFAILVAANAQLLQSYPAKLRQVLEEGNAKVTGELRAAVQKIEKNTTISSDLVAQIRHVVEENSALIAEERKTAAQEWNNKISELRRDYNDLQRQQKKLTEFKTHLFWSAIGGALIIGMLLEGLLSVFMRWGR